MAAVTLPRRALLCAGLLGLVAALAGCGGNGRLARADVARRPARSDLVPLVVDAVGAFAGDLLAGVPAGGNVVCSPYSVLVALAMVRHGATGATAEEMDDVLRLPSPPLLAAGLNALDQALATRAGRRRNAAGTSASVVIDLANRVWGQRGLVWEPAFLETLAASYGTGVAEVDIASDPEGARRAVNDWVAAQTHERITGLMPAGSVTGDTRMVLANALYVRAPWHEALVPAGSLTFAAPDGPVTVSALGATLARGGMVGAGWRAARVPLAGQELAWTVVRPDRDLADLRARLRGDGLTRLLRTAPDTATALRMPPLRVRSELDLIALLRALGMPRLFDPGCAELDALTRSEALHVSAVRHQGWLALDAEGLEAAAATGVSVSAVSAPAVELQVVLDRPYLACLHDVATALPLLVVQVNDPGPT